MTRRKPPSKAEGKRFGTTQITPEKSQFDIQGVLTKYGVEASQWTVLPHAYTLRFRLNGRNYLFTIPRDANDMQETRRLFRVIYWYLDTMLAAMDSDKFSPESVFLAFTEIAPETTLHQVLVRQAERAGVVLRWGTAARALGPEGVELGGERVRSGWVVERTGLAPASARGQAWGPRPPGASASAYADTIESRPGAIVSRCAGGRAARPT
jgi:hypothetical protein